ncbi:MAG: adenylate/guanylate cyclase domain-containing protein [Pseudomonadota bacterium]
MKSLGDGILATFDGPGRAIRFSRELRDALSTLGLQIRQGLHTGEIEVSNNDVSGIAVNISARVMDLAGPSQIFSSRTVKDLVAGSGLQFEEIGRRQLKGIPDEWEIFSVM